jgi:hypothetical protein
MGVDCVRLEGKVWNVYKYFSSKEAAEKGRRWLWSAWGKQGVSPLRVVKTSKGWGVFQCSRGKEYQIPKSKLVRVD